MRIAAIDILLHHHIRPSEQRIAILQYLITHRTHPSADTIYEHLHPTMPTLSRTTVYNVLRHLVENGAVQTLTIDDKNVRFDADTTPHAHFRCTTCGTLYDMPQPTMPPPTAPHFTIRHVQVYYSGTCPHCQNHTASH